MTGQLPAGFAPDTSSKTPDGFEPDVPTFHVDNAKDAQGNPIVSAGEALIDHLINWLPAIGGTVGGIGGGIGGTVFGLGVGGVPGAVGGATLGGAAGEAYKELINRARGRTAPATSLQAAGSIGKEAAIQGASQAVGEAVTPVARTLGARIMQGAVKPGLRALTRGAQAGEVPRVVQTLLDEGVNVTPGGVAKLRGLLDATNDEISQAIAAASGDVNPIKVASRLSQTAKTFGQQVNSTADLDAISQVGQNFLEAHGGRALSLPEAQALKVGTYARIGEKYGQAGAAAIEAEKSLARGLKEEIASHLPSVNGLNAREGRLLEALNVLGRRVALAGNRDPIGFAWVAHNPTTFLAALIDRSPAVKSLLARGLYNDAAKFGNVSAGLVRAAVHAIASDDPQAASVQGSSDQGHPQ